MRRDIFCRLIFIIVLVFYNDCEDSSSKVSEDTLLKCKDGIDNDNDGKVDCEDEGCYFYCKGGEDRSLDIGGDHVDIEVDRSECIDRDGDGYGIGEDCEGIDCDDTNPNCNIDCTDQDQDGVCTDIDCDDTDPNNWVSCDSCKDEDQDGYYIGCDSYNTIEGPDCDDQGQFCRNDCSDSNGDGIRECCILSPYEIVSYEFIDVTEVEALFIEDSLAYIGVVKNLSPIGRRLEILILDITDPTSPVAVSNINLSTYYISYINEIFVDNGYLFTAENRGVLHIVNVSDPLHPYLVSEYMEGGNRFIRAYDVEVQDNTVYLSVTDTGLIILDITDPSSPEKNSEYSISRARGIDIEVDRLYVTSLDEGLLVFDISDSSSVNLLNSYELKDAIDICVKDHIYVITRDGKFLILDSVGLVSNGFVLVGEYDGDFSFKRLYVDSSYAYITAKEKGLVIIDITDPLNPTEVVYYQSSDLGLLYDVDKKDNFLYVTDKTKGSLRIISLNCGD